jgi:hypothetical protein
LDYDDEPSDHAAEILGEHTEAVWQGSHWLVFADAGWIGNVGFHDLGTFIARPAPYALLPTGLLGPDAWELIELLVRISRFRVP